MEEECHCGCRAHIGHSHLTQPYILNKYSPPRNEKGRCIVAIHHISECSHLAQTRWILIF